MENRAPASYLDPPCILRIRKFGDPIPHLVVKQFWSVGIKVQCESRETERMKLPSQCWSVLDPFYWRCTSGSIGKRILIKVPRCGQLFLVMSDLLPLWWKVSTILKYLNECLLISQAGFPIFWMYLKVWIQGFKGRRKKYLITINSVSINRLRLLHTRVYHFDACIIGDIYI